MTEIPVRILFVCMGNICRSPLAESIFRHLLAERGVEDLFEVDSAGTSGYHAGDPPDPRSAMHASRRGYDLSALRARRVREADFERFDLVLAMDWENLELLQAQCPAAHRGKLRRLTEFARRLDAEVVPDPYYSGADGFEHVLDVVEDACDGLVAHLLAAPHQTGGTS